MLTRCVRLWHIGGKKFGFQVLWERVYVFDFGPYRNPSVGFCPGVIIVQNEQISLVWWTKWLGVWAGTWQVHSAWKSVFYPCGMQPAVLMCHIKETCEMLYLSQSNCHVSGYYYLCHGSHNLCGLNQTSSCAGVYLYWSH